MTFIDILDGGSAPKRGDLVQSNVGDRRERTWFILRVRAVKRFHRNTCGSLARRGEVNLERCDCGWAQKPPRYTVWMARWWELEPEMRQRLARSAERAGGQRVIYFRRYPAKKRRHHPGRC